MQRLLLLALLIFSTAAFSSSREQFVTAVVKQCKVTKEEAQKLATPGRMGTVVRFKICPQKNMTLENGCVLTCKSEGAEL
jgi:hypothetical protein